MWITKKLQVAHLISREKFTDDRQLETEKMKRLQEEQEQLQVPHLEVKQRYGTELMCVRKQAGVLQHELNKSRSGRTCFINILRSCKPHLSTAKRTSAAELQVKIEQKKLLQE